MEKNPRFLIEKYEGLSKAPEVISAQKRAKKRGKDVSEKEPEELVQNYLDRFKEIIEGKDPQERRQGIENLKQILYDKFIASGAEDIPESYWRSIQERHRQEGHGEIEISEALKKELSQPIIEDQKKSLSAWIDYLASPDAKYPDWLKYYTIRSILKMGRYDKKKKIFRDRYGKTISPFPEINREALAFVLDAMEKEQDHQTIALAENISDEDQEKFKQLLKGKNFNKLYSWAIEQINPVPENLMRVTQGIWVKYPKGFDPQKLVRSLENYATGWCIRAEATAQRYLQDNDLEVYYSFDAQDEPKIPRVVIVSNNDQITEVRGIAEQENLDSYINEVVENKLKALLGGEGFKKKSADMKKMTELVKKQEQGESLTKDDLVFLYELNAPIEGFGYEKDPRVQELRKQRNPGEDMPIVFECSREQIATGASEINKDTKAFVGKLEPGIFGLIQKYNIEYVYTIFPEGKIRRENLEIGGKTAEILKREMREKGIKISDYSQDMLKSKDFSTLENPEQVTLVRLKVRDLGFEESVIIGEIYRRAEKLGLELCPAEVGPNLRIKYIDQPLDEWFLIGMKQIPGRDGRLDVFVLGRSGGGLWLDGAWARPDGRWHPEREFVFCLRKLET